jgi:hypothetical protein
MNMADRWDIVRLRIIVGFALYLVASPAIGAEGGMLLHVNKPINHNGGWFRSIYVTPDEFILTIAPPSYNRGVLYAEITGPDMKPVRVVGYEIGTATKRPFTVHLPRTYKKLYIRGINNFGRDTSLDLTRFDEYVKARTGVEELKDAIKPTLEITEPAFSGPLYRTEDLSLTVEGRATDNLAVTKVQVNGEPVSLRSDGAFKYRLRLKFGRNTVVIRAVDVNDNVSVHSFTVLRDEIVQDTQFSDVDFPSATTAKSPDGIAVVIGIESYRHAPAASHAINDAEIIREYLVKRFGYDRRNILLRLDEQATKGEFERIFGPNGWLERQVTSTSQVTVYYSGHGSPDTGSGSAFLVPYDIDPNYPSTGYAVSELYASLESLPAESVTLMLDACFSGTSRANEPLLVGARPVALQVEEVLPQKKLVVLSAASGTQISSSAEDRLHGLFTYFILKGMQGEADSNADRIITTGEMNTYTNNHVPTEARRLGREQTPQLHGDADRVLVRW